MVIGFQNCSDLLWEKIILAIKKKQLFEITIAQSKGYVNICDFWLTLTGTIWLIGTGFCFLRIWTCCISGIIFNHISYWNFTWVSFNPSYIVCGCLFVSIGTKLKTFELSIRKLTWNQKTIYYILQQKSFSF